MIRVRPIRCGSCGARQAAEASAGFLVCQFCGALAAVDGSVLRSERRQELEQQWRQQFLQPSALQARIAVLTQMLQQARMQGDEETHRQLAWEMASLQVAQQEQTRGKPLDDATRRLRVARQAFALHAPAFDPKLQAAQQAIAEASAAVMGDPASAEQNVQRLIEAHVAFQRALIGHRDYPQGHEPMPKPTHLAKEMVRNQLESLASLFPPGTVEKWLKRFFRDQLAEEEGRVRCPSCGAPVPVPEGETVEAYQCPYCQAEIRLETQDLWLTNALGQWRAAHPGSAPPSVEDALHWLVWVANLPEGDGADERAARFLREVLPQVDADEVLQVARRERSKWPHRLALLEAAAERLRQMPPAQPAASAEPQDAAGEPVPVDAQWVEMQVQMWKHNPAKLGLASERAKQMLAILQDALQQGGDVRPEQALELVRRDEPELLGPPMATAVRYYRSALPMLGLSPSVFERFHRLLDALEQASGSPPSS